MRLCSGIAAATMFTAEKLTEVSESQLRVAFDGDAVLFSDESERIFKAHGLDKFFEHERENEDTLLDHVRKVPTYERISLVLNLGGLVVNFTAKMALKAVACVYFMISSCLFPLASCVSPVCHMPRPLMCHTCLPLTP